MTRIPFTCPSEEQLITHLERLDIFQALSGEEGCDSEWIRKVLLAEELTESQG